LHSSIEHDLFRFVVDLERETDIERLRQVALLQKSQLEHLISIHAKKCAELEKLKGSGGELQRSLAFIEAARKEAAALADAIEAAARSAAEQTSGKTDDETPAEGSERRGHGPKEQLRLERVPLRCTLDDSARACRECGGGLVPMKGQCETSEMIDVVDIKYVVVEVERQKYVCKCGSAVETAPGPERAIDGGRYSLRFAVKVAFDKYVNHLPLERQVRAMSHYGLDVTSQTLWDQCSAVTDLLSPTYDAVFKQLRAGPVIGLDQTSWPDLEDKTLPPWQMWCFTAPGLVYHQICDDKSAATFKSLVGDYAGTIVCDAAATHIKGARGEERLTLAGCWAHAYRRFEEAGDDFPAALIVRAWIQDLYRIDAQATTTEQRARLRATESAAVLEKMKSWMHEQRVLATTSLGSAIRYTLKSWDRLTVFVRDPLVWLDNNRTERGIRGPVIGRRNHFGSKSARGTVVAATLYSLVESAKVAGLDPVAYLVEVATRAKRTPGAVLLPDDFKAAA
jgi:transposase